MRTASLISAAAAGALLLAVAGDARADDTGRCQVSLLGGMQVLNHENTGLPERFVDIPAAASLDFDLNPVWAVDGELATVIPVSKSVDLGAAGAQDRKTPDLVSYQANAIARLPLASAWSPYLAGGLGAVSFLKNTDPDRLPELGKSETDFAIDFGAGTTHRIGSRWGLRADFRELAAFPSKNAVGFSSGGKADAIWMERAALGLTYRI